MKPESLRQAKTSNEKTEKALSYGLNRKKMKLAE